MTLLWIEFKSFLVETYLNLVMVAKFIQIPAKIGKAECYIQTEIVKLNTVIVK